MQSYLQKAIQESRIGGHSRTKLFDDKWDTDILSNECKKCALVSAAENMHGRACEGLLQPDNENDEIKELCVGF